MNKFILASIVGLATLGAAAPAFADHRDRDDDEWREHHREWRHHGHHGNRAHFWYRQGGFRPVYYYQPAPAYVVQPQPVYYAPAPVRYYDTPDSGLYLNLNFH